MLRLSRALLALAVLAACDRRADAPPPDSVAPAQSVVTPPARSWQGSWAPALGDLLALPSDSATAVIVYPDDPAALAGGASVILLTTAGDTVARATLTLDDTLQCGGAPVARLGAGAPTTWDVALHGATARALRVDSTEALTAGDSARAIAEIVKLASVATAKSSSRFTGLPFAVLSAHRFTVGSRQVIVAHLIRRLPQEAAPLEEHTLLIAERATAGGALQTVFSDLSQGSEETAHYFDVVAAVGTNDAAFVILARDTMARSEYQVLERDARGKWHVRWTRPLAC